MSGLEGLEAVHSASIVDCPACKHLFPGGFGEGEDGHRVVEAADCIHRDLRNAIKMHFAAEATRDQATVRMRSTADQAKYLSVALSAMLTQAAADDQAQLDGKVGEQ